jgi:hypothetical protein
LEKDIAALRINGLAGSGFGSKVAASDAGVLVAAPSDNEISLWSWDGEPLNKWSVPLNNASELYLNDNDAFVWVDNHLFSLDSDQSVVEIASGTAPPVYCESQWFWATSGGGAAVRCSPDGVIEKICVGGNCTIAVNPSGEGISPDGDYFFTDFGWCFGMVDSEDNEDGGEVYCESGNSIKGAGGERTGQQITRRWTSGTMGRQYRPPRGHVRSLDTTVSLVVESGSDAQPYALAEFEDNLVVGVPTAQLNEVNGAVWLVQFSSILP